MAARYEIAAETLAHSIVGQPVGTVRSIDALDYRADPVLEAALAVAANVDRNWITRMRRVKADGSSSCWYRQGHAWCPDCFRDDLERHGEVHERAVWRLGCWVLCPVHRRRMQSTCSRCDQCDRKSRCFYLPVSGFLRLGCSVCDRPVDDRAGRAWLDDTRGAFGIMQTRSLVDLVLDFQSDLTAVLEAEQPVRAWGYTRIGQMLLTITTDLMLAFVLSTGMRVGTRLDLAKVERKEALGTWHERITLASLHPYLAFGLMAITATFLETLPAGTVASHEWRPIDRIELLGASSILSWLDQDGRRWLQTFSAGWDERTRRATCGANEQM